MTQTPNSRIPGLDTLRALAIVLVLCNHYTVVVTQEFTFGLLSRWGWIGVDLFFALSGYLIGSQIMAPLARGEGFSLPVFMARRLLRTLPNYYVILALYLAVPALAGTATAPGWQFLTFTQNFSFTHWGQTFSHSWSLCIEEQFYVLLPLASLLIMRTRQPVTKAWLTVLAVLAAGMAARAWCWLHMDPAANGAPFYYATFTRFDELLPGVMIAMLRHFHPAIFARWLRHANALLLAGVLLVALDLYWLGDQVAHTLPAAVLGYPLLAIGFALMVFACLEPAAWLNR